MKAKAGLMAAWVALGNLASTDAVADFEQRLEWDFGLQQKVYADTGYRQSSQTNTVLRGSAQWQGQWQTPAGNLQQLTVKPWLRHDTRDSDGNRVDFPELSYLYVGDGLSFKIGRSQVFWGVTESAHLVNIINQTDLIDDPRGESFIGQNMVNLNIELDQGNLEFYLLQGFEPRPFAGEGGRFSLPFSIDSKVRYAPDHQSQHFDYAFRWYQFLGPLELGLSYFGGTSRDPVFRSSDIKLEFSGEDLTSVVLQPTYYTIDQLGLDAQLLLGNWALKLEAIERHGEETWLPSDDRVYRAAATGFEYTQVGVLDSRWDFGYILEYVYDDRRELAPTFADNDWRLGLRWAFNDIRNSSMLLGFNVDRQTREQLFTLEAETRITANSTLEARAWWFRGSDLPDDNLADRFAALTNFDNKAWFLGRDNLIEVEWHFYF